MHVSARNQLRGNVKSVKLGTLMAGVVVKVGGQDVVAAITRQSAEALGLAKGSDVVAITKPTDVVLGTPD